ncbi:MAG: EscU/YscU/HrcU family type III secretion system export apparatus switch protein [Campylobacterota bacterium]|nr:EscU/YscU/HrcU family type III secretion system export apparatus switch protein [Campylobacterota bacterium]
MENNFIKKAASLKYDDSKDGAPSVTSYGTKQTANNIIKIAQENDIPIKKDEDLVNMLSEIELNQEIPIELYKAVAEVFSFVYEMANEEKDKQ